jgi:dinuclear metal center YbgI/SA1388 family protein
LIKPSRGDSAEVKRKELENWLNEYLNVSAVSDYLPNGLQVEGKEEIEKIITAVSINLDVVHEAVSENADAVIVHHGMFWKSEERTVKGYRRARLHELLRNNINLFAFHLPLDTHPEISHNRIILEHIGVDHITGAQENGKEFECGLKGMFSAPIGFKELVHRINESLHTESRYFHYGKERIGSVFVVSGAGRNLIDKVSALEVDAFLTGDAAENTQHIAKEERINYIYAGHYNTEKPGIIELGRKIAEKLHLNVRFFDCGNLL